MSNGNGASEAPTKRCGNCVHAQRIDLQKVICFGAPPTPVVTGGRQGQFGKVEYAIELIRPQLHINERACAVWQQAAPFIDLGAAQSAGKPM